MNSQSFTEKQAKIGKFVYINADTQKIFKKLLDSIFFGNHCSILVGPGGVGKSLMLHRLIDILGASIQSLYFDRCYEDFDDLITDMSQALHLDFESGQDLKGLESYFDSWTKGRQQIAMFFDKVDSYGEQTFAQLLSFIETISHKKNSPSVILSGRTSLLNNLDNLRANRLHKNMATGRYELLPLPIQEIQTYVNKRQMHFGLGGKILFSDAAVTKIAYYSKGIPESINKICDDVISGHTDLFTGEITEDMVEQLVSSELASSFIEVSDLLPPADQDDESKDQSLSSEASQSFGNFASDSTETLDPKPESMNKKLDDKQLPVYDPNRCSSSGDIPQKNNSDSGSEITYPEESISPTKVSINKNNQNSSRKETQRADDNAGKTTIERWFDRSNEDPVSPLPRKDETLDVEVNENEGWRKAVLCLLPVVLLIVAAALLNFSVLKKREFLSKKSDQLASEHNIEPELEAKQDLETMDVPDFENPTVDLPVAEDPVLKGEEQSGDKRLEKALLSESQNSEKKSSFVAEPELLRMKEMEKRPNDAGYEYSILIDASKKGYSKVVDQLLEYGYDVNTRGEYGNTALIWSVINNHFETVQVLLEGKADFSISNKLGATAMSLAIHNGNIQIIEILLNAGANPHTTDKKNRTTLMVAADQEDGNAELVARLIGLGVNLDAVSQSGRTALMNAAEKGNLQIVKILLNHYPDVSMTDQNGDSAAEIASKAGFDELANLISAPAVEYRNK